MYEQCRCSVVREKRQCAGVDNNHTKMLSAVTAYLLSKKNFFLSQTYLHIILLLKASECVLVNTTSITHTDIFFRLLNIFIDIT